MCHPCSRTVFAMVRFLRTEVWILSVVLRFGLVPKQKRLLLKIQNENQGSCPVKLAAQKHASGLVAFSTVCLTSGSSGADFTTDQVLSNGNFPQRSFCCHLPGYILGYMKRKKADLLRAHQQNEKLSALVKRKLCTLSVLEHWTSRVCLVLGM